MKTSGAFKPFRHLKHMLHRNATPVESLPAERFRIRDNRTRSADHDQRLFERAMVDVTPLAHGRNRPADPVPLLPTPHQTESDPTLGALRDLVQTGRGYRVADTPEYIEGTGCRVPAGVARLLHRGTFSIQAHIDLHGLTVPVAREAVDTFLRDAVRRGLGGVLIVHGRGLSSAAEPVLKAHVVRWLTTGIWRKWVLAYTSARSCDGGAGATYVLLRPRPLAKRHRRSKPERHTD
jgi:DNA-nicking Smr family endonuclease